MLCSDGKTSGVRGGWSPLTMLSLLLAAAGVFLLVTSGQLVLGCAAAALAVLFIPGRGGR